MNEPVLEIRDVHYGYPGGQQVLCGANLVLSRAERIGLIGSNGSGKTTLLHAMVGLLPISSGRISVAGRPCIAEGDYVEARRRVGLLFQDPDDQLFCTTVAEDLAFGPFNLDLHRDEVERRVTAALTTLAIEHLRERVTYRLSEGEKRLVSLGTLLTMEPDVLLLDEPTNGLDDKARARLIELLLKLPQAMLIVSHDQAFLDAVATRKLHLADGRLQ